MAGCFKSDTGSSPLPASLQVGQKFENFNYLNVAFISYKLTMWDLMLFSGCHTRGQRLRKKDRSC